MAHFDQKVVEQISREQSDLLNTALPTDPDDRLLSFARQNIGLYYKNCPVTRFGRLADVTGQPLRVSEVDIFASDVYWWYGNSAANLITHANGFGTPADASWQFAGLKKFQIVLYQPGGNAFGIESDSSSSPQHLSLNPNLDILVGVNDVINTYYDNTGAFSIYIRVIA